MKIDTLFLQEIVVFNLEKDCQTLRLRQIRLDDSVDPAAFAAAEWIQVIKRSLSPANAR